MKQAVLLYYFVVILGFRATAQLDHLHTSESLNVVPLRSSFVNVVPVKNGNQILNRSNLTLLDKLRKQFPKCPLSCEESWINDGWCDKECFSDHCGNDGGDCVGWCAPECRPTWLGDGQCDVDCFNSNCNWDNNDCKSNNFEQIKEIVINLEKNATNTTNFEFDYSKCNCNKELLGNNVCDVECNKIECNMDKGDCLHRCNSRCINMWLGDGQCDPSCDTEECFFDKGDCKTCSGNCRTWMIGNGICDKSCNNKECNYDGGDCANVCSVSKVDYNNQPLIYKFCLKSWVGDGYCDEDCNNEECNFDKGDCNSKENNDLLSNALFTYEASLNPPRKVKSIKNKENNTTMNTSNSKVNSQNGQYMPSNNSITTKVTTATTTTTTTTTTTIITASAINNITRNTDIYSFFKTINSEANLFGNNTIYSITSTSTVNSNLNLIRNNDQSTNSLNMLEYPRNSNRQTQYLTQNSSSQNRQYYYYPYNPQSGYYNNYGTSNNFYPQHNKNQNYLYNNNNHNQIQVSKMNSHQNNNNNHRYTNHISNVNQNGNFRNFNDRIN